MFVLEEEKLSLVNQLLKNNQSTLPEPRSGVADSPENDPQDGQ
jgi:hypothetical protein